MKVVAFVPIKLNSQRLPNKNILPLNGKPLCWHVCKTLLEVDGIDDVYIYCSDDSVTNYIPKDCVYLKRPEKLDGDRVKGGEIYNEFVKAVDADIYVLAHTTSPFLKANTIEHSLKKVLSGENDSAFSALRVQTFAWYKGHPINYSLTDIPRTQDIEPVWVETSGFYIFRKETFTCNGKRIGDSPYICEVKGKESIDIDNKEDYELACKYVEVGSL